jgi:hypothetical protein
MSQLYLWDAKSNTIIDNVTYLDAEIILTSIDEINKTIIITIQINKKNETWIYFKIQDKYPKNRSLYNNLTIKNINGTIINEERWWRENNTIYILDKPEREYFVVYDLVSPHPLFDVLIEFTDTIVTKGERINGLITLINVGEPGLVNVSITYTLLKDGEVVWLKQDIITVLGQVTYSKTISTSGLPPGTYTYSVVNNYGVNQTASATKEFKILSSESFPLYIILGVLIFILIIIFIMYKFGWIKLEKTPRSGEFKPKTYNSKTQKYSDDINKSDRKSFNRIESKIDDISKKSLLVLTYYILFIK